MCELIKMMNSVVFRLFMAILFVLLIINPIVNGPVLSEAEKTEISKDCFLRVGPRNISCVFTDDPILYMVKTYIVLVEDFYNLRIFLVKMLSKFLEYACQFYWNTIKYLKSLLIIQMLWVFYDIARVLFGSYYVYSTFIRPRLFSVQLIERHLDTLEDLESSFSLSDCSPSIRFIFPGSISTHSISESFDAWSRIERPLMSSTIEIEHCSNDELNMKQDHDSSQSQNLSLGQCSDTCLSSGIRRMANDKITYNCEDSLTRLSRSMPSLHISDNSKGMSLLYNSISCSSIALPTRSSFALAGPPYTSSSDSDSYKSVSSFKRSSSASSITSVCSDITDIGDQATFVYDQLAEVENLTEEIDQEIDPSEPIISQKSEKSDSTVVYSLYKYPVHGSITSSDPQQPLLQRCQREYVFFQRPTYYRDEPVSDWLAKRFHPSPPPSKIKCQHCVRIRRRKVKQLPWKKRIIENRPTFMNDSLFLINRSRTDVILDGIPDGVVENTPCKPWGSMIELHHPSNSHVSRIHSSLPNITKEFVFKNRVDFNARNFEDFTAPKDRREFDVIERYWLSKSEIEEQNEKMEQVLRANEVRRQESIHRMRRFLPSSDELIEEMPLPIKLPPTRFQELRRQVKNEIFVPILFHVGKDLLLSVAFDIFTKAVG